MITRYSYDGLYAAAKENPTPENIEKLVYWLDMFDPGAWNGEKYFADDIEIFPVYNDDIEIIGYSIF